MPTLQEVRALHDLPLPELLFRAQSVHRQHHAADEVQLCTLLSVKTGGCPEDCSYCPQSSHYETPVSVEKSLAVVVYNAVWFAVPIIALVACFLRPAAARDIVGWLRDWTQRHARAIFLTVSFSVGAALIVRGLVGL